MATPEIVYRPLGRCGTKVSVYGLGGWTTFGHSVSDEDTIRSIIRVAFDAGINFFDTADIYAKGACERAMGKALADFPRSELVLSTKLFWPMSDDVNDRGLSRKHIMESVEKSLERFGTDYFDIYFCHRFDPETPFEETARAMDDLVRQGKVLYWGTSEWTGPQIAAAHEACRDRNLQAPQVEQPQCSLLYRGKFEHSVRPVAEALGMGLVLWSPLASGILTGKYDDGVPPDSRLGQIEWLRDEILTEENVGRARAFAGIAKKMGCSRAQLALAWARSQRGVSSVILGATSVAQLEENLQSLSVEIDERVAAELNEAFPVKPWIDKEG